MLKKVSMSRNILWSWATVVVNLFASFVLTPYIIRKLGLEGYGIWALVFSITGYYTLLDLGFRSAAVRYTAHYRAKGEDHRLNVLVNTLLAYFTLIALLIFGLTLLLAPYVAGWFEISEQFAPQIPLLVILVGSTFGIGVAFNIFTGFVEGFQRFDLVNGIWLTAFGIRHPGCALLLYLGYGLVEMAALSLGTQLLMCTLYLIASKRMFPELRFHWKLMEWATLKETFSFGAFTFVSGVSGQSLEQTPQILIGHLRSVAEVGFYTLPYRLLQYSADGVSRIGQILTPRTAELAATGQKETIARLVTLANRYSLLLYMPLTLFLLNWGSNTLYVWLKEKGPEVAEQSGALLPVMLVGFTYGLAGQFSSSSALFGLNKHHKYAVGMAIEAVLSAGLMILTLPRYGIMAAAAVASTLILLRGLYASFLFSRAVEIPWLSYLNGIWGGPTAIAIPVYAMGWWLQSVIPGRNWGELIAAGVLTAGTYLPLGFIFCLDAEHRDKLLKVARLKTA